MKWMRNVALSRKALWRHKARTILALSGTAVGVAVVLAMVAIGEGAKREVVTRVQATGRNMLVVNAGLQERRAGRPLVRGAIVETLTLADASAIAEESGFVARVAPSFNDPKQITHRDLSTAATVRGTTTEYSLIRDFPTSVGRFFSAEENRAGMRVAVLGSVVAERLFPDSDPVGQVIRVGRVPFEVVGVLIEKGISVDGSAQEDNQVIVPINTALRRVFNADFLKMIYLEVTSATLMDEAEQEVAAILRERHRLARYDRADDFRIENQRVIMNAELATVASFRRMITGMGAVALAVGGVGILSIMLLSVRERRSEIGLRVAVGARRRDVWVQFLVEAVVLSAAGGMLGLVLGIASSSVVSAVTEWTAAVTPPSIALAVVSALTVGVVFGVYPAFRAASWDPIEALRTE
jgi:putative ABC transport system permease protein